MTKNSTSTPDNSKPRIDKWLWAARFFKTRALASKACDLGRILFNGHEAKPARELELAYKDGIFEGVTSDASAVKVCGWVGIDD